METLQGVVDHIIFQAEADGFVIFSLKEGRKKTPVTVTGKYPGLLAGEEIEVSGMWVEHPKFGRQLKADSIKRVLPETKDGIVRFLSSGLISGVGPALAKRIAERFGEETLAVLEKEPERLEEVPGIGKKKLESIVESFRETQSLRDITLILEQHGVSGAYGPKILAAYGDDAVYVLENEPYRMVWEVDGIGFKIADQLAVAMGEKKNSRQRIKGGVEYVLSYLYQSGDVCAPEGWVIEKTAQVLQIDRLEAAEALKRMIRQQDIMAVCYAGQTYIYPERLYRAEKEAAEAVLRLLHKKVKGEKFPIESYLMRWQDSHHVRLSEQQEEAVRQAMAAGVLIVTGGPGTGKTTVVQAMIDALDRNGRRVILCAPTGRAAKRMAETTGREALTIHRLLSPAGVLQGEMKFEANEENPLRADVIIVDEVSMVDLLLFYNLLKAMPASCRLILVGDADQLPSVGVGNVLHDLIRSEEVPVVRLKEVFRQDDGSSIIENAHRINHGNMPVWQDKRDFYFLQENDETAAAGKIAALYMQELHCTEDAFSVQVLSPMHRMPCGVENLNELLQSAVNPEKPGAGECRAGKMTLRIGDKVLQKKNNYEKGVFNGDIGVVWSIQGDKVGIRFIEKDVLYTADEVNELALAYAMTVHKSQGSEYKTVIIALANSHFVMLQRNLLYTAITRAKEKVILVGTEKALRMAVQNGKTRKRLTLLCERLRGEELW